MRTCVLSVIALVALALPTLAQQQLSVPPWQVTLGPTGAAAIAYDGATIARNLNLSGFLPDYKGGRFDLRDATLSTTASSAKWTKQAAGNQDATLTVKLEPRQCAITLESTLYTAGPNEFSLALDAGALASTPGSMHLMVDGKRRTLDLGGSFSTFSIAREIVIEQPERTVTIRCPGYVLQDRRSKNMGLFLVTSFAGVEPWPAKVTRSLEISIEPAAPAEVAARRARLLQRDAVRTSIPVPDGDFEQGLGKWSANPRAAVDTAVFHGGKQSARITIPETQTDRTGIYLTQQVPVRPGASYQASVWARAANVKPAALGDMTPTGATIILEWADKDGKWLAPGDYAEGLYETKDWWQISTDSCRAPERAGFAVIFLSMRATGTGWFDDVTLQEIQHNVVLNAPGDQTTLADNTPAFEWSIVGPGDSILEISTSPTFEPTSTQRFGDIKVHNFVLDKPLAAGKYYWRVSTPSAAATSAVWSFTQTAPVTADCSDPVVAADHTYLARPDDRAVVHVSDNIKVVRTELTLDGAAVKPAPAGGGKLAAGADTVAVVPPGGWTPGLHRLLVKSFDAAGNMGSRLIYITHAPKLPQKQWLAQGGVATDGKPRFLLGMYGILTEHLPEMQKAGIDYVHNYTWDGPGTNESALAYLDACQRHNLQAFIGFNRASLQANDFDFVAERVGKLMAHPALLAWYLFDEPDLPHQYVSPDQLRGLYRLIHALDPSHPVIVTVAQRNLMPDYRDSYDVYWSMDYRTPAANVENFEFHKAALKPGVPIMSILHSYDGKQKGKIDPAKFQPDGPMMRACAFMAIAHNSSGLCWWWWGQGSDIYATVANVPEAWASLKQTLADIRSLEPVLTSPAPARMWVEKPAEGQEVHCWEKTVGGRTVIIAVNRDPKPCEAKLTSPKLKAGAVGVLFEKRTVQAQAGSLVETFKPLEVHVYEVR